MHSKGNHRYPIRSIEGKKNKKNGDRDSQNKKESHIKNIVQGEQNRSHANHPKNLFPSQWAGYLVFNINKLGYIEHHTRKVLLIPLTNWSNVELTRSRSW